MPSFLYRGAYTTQAWSGLVAEPRDITEAMKASAESFGGKVVACFLVMGPSGAEPGGFMEFPDNVSATAWVVSLLGAGILSRADITPVLTGQETLDVLSKARAGGSGDGGGWGG